MKKERLGEMNFPQTPILLFLSIGAGWQAVPAVPGRCWLGDWHQKIFYGAGCEVAPAQ